MKITIEFKDVNEYLEFKKKDTQEKVFQGQKGFTNSEHKRQIK